MSSSDHFLIVVVGPTAVGKTSFCIQLAQHFNTEIISADSRQFFQEMAIGTAKPSLEEMNEVKHHFINNLSIHQNYTIADFEKHGLSLLNSLFVQFPLLILTGGSGMYVEALCEGIDAIPAVDSAIRSTLNEAYKTHGITHLQRMLQVQDPDYFDQVDQANPQRLMRALEVCLGTGKPFSSFRKKKTKQRPFNIIKIGLELPREVLYERINQRMDNMVEDGLFDEARRLFPLRHLNALQTVGYKEIFGYLEGQYDKEETIRLLKRNSRRYAKRQMTWFKKDEQILWFSPEEFDSVVDTIKSKV